MTLRKCPLCNNKCLINLNAYRNPRQIPKALHSVAAVRMKSVDFNYLSLFAALVLFNGNVCGALLGSQGFRLVVALGKRNRCNHALL